jgi:hypothetical protein
VRRHIYRVTLVPAGGAGSFGARDSEPISEVEPQR